MASLVDKAKALKTDKRAIRVNEDTIALAISWAKDEISLAQAEMVLFGKKSGPKAYVIFARALREGFRRGTLK